MNQQKLQHFFDVSVEYSNKERRCFIYSPYEKVAYFDYEPQPTDIFVIKKSLLRLFYRPGLSSHYAWDFSKYHSIYAVPILKSNMQKAIRRKMGECAVNTFVGLLAANPIEALRRLAIIYIEDVCLMDSYPIVIWLMMADNAHQMTAVDIFLLCCIIESLVKTDRVIDTSGDRSYKTDTSKKASEYENPAVRALYYRTLYGGMKGDIAMLKSAVEFYDEYPKEIVETIWPDSIRFSNEIPIIPEAIDFHPYPNILYDISAIKKIKINVIKNIIWIAESGVNVRKPETMEASRVALTSAIWIEIRELLYQLRREKL